jgi:hypothetical protein
MSNETPVTLAECVDWLELIGTTYFESVDTSNPNFHKYRRAILSHLRASAAKGDDAGHQLVAQLEALAARTEAAAKIVRELRAAPGEAKCGMGHEDALSAITKHVHEIQVLCDAFGYDPSQWLQDEVANELDCAPSPEQQDAYLDCPKCGDLEQHQSQCLRTAPAPALGLSDDVINLAIRALHRDINFAMEMAKHWYQKGLFSSLEKGNAARDHAKKCEAACTSLRSLLERVKP